MPRVGLKAKSLQKFGLKFQLDVLNRVFILNCKLQFLASTLVLNCDLMRAYTGTTTTKNRIKKIHPKFRVNQKKVVKLKKLVYLSLSILLTSISTQTALCLFSKQAKCLTNFRI